MYHKKKKLNIGSNKSSISESGTMKNSSQISYKWSPLGQFTTLGEQSCENIAVLNWAAYLHYSI